MWGEARLVVQNELAELERLAEFLSQFGTEHNLSEDLSFELNLALEEIFCNIVKHGYQDEACHQITVSLALSEGTVSLSVADDAPAFNPLEAPEPILDRPLEDRPIGGLGIHIVRRVMEDVEYRREGDRNILLMKKRVEKNA